MKYIIFLIVSINIQNETDDSGLEFHDLLNLEIKNVPLCPTNVPLLIHFFEQDIFGAGQNGTLPPPQHPFAF